MNMTTLNRRALLKTMGCSLALASATLPRIAFASPAIDKRLIVIVQRGGMDGLAAIPAYGDPAFETARAGIATPPPGSAGGALPLDSTFGLHPELVEFATLYGEKSLLPIQAACVAYHGRSHFEAQNVLENGSAIPYFLKTGWLNRSLSALPASSGDVGIAIAQTMPVIMRGDATVTSWYPSILPQPNDDTIGRIAAMYAADPKLDAALQRARTAHEMATDTDPGSQFASLMTAAGGFLAKPNGPRVAMIESTGWDTHANQAANYGALDRNLRQLNRGVVALRTALGAEWNNTAVLIMTEFGRTVAMNGTQGTDHGTGGAAFLLGGAVAGGKVLADWPGLRPNNLYEGRDLRPTTDLRSVMKGVLAEHLGIPDAHIERVVFPDSADVRPIRDLVRA
jgi:uncharacterized protein (DUF1501 family)